MLLTLENGTIKLVIGDFPDRTDSFSILRGTVSAGVTTWDSTPLVTGLDENIEYIDSTAVVGLTYSYILVAVNESGSTSSEPTEPITLLEPGVFGPPVLVGTIKNIFNSINQFLYHLIYIKSPVWTSNSPQSIIGMELWVKEEGGVYELVTSMPMTDVDGEVQVVNDNPYYIASEAITEQRVNRATRYFYKVRGFYDNDEDVRVYLPYSEELEVNLFSQSCTVNITNPIEGVTVLFKTNILFTVEDDEGHSREEILINGFNAQI
jgi:hypothetical protein